MKNKSLMLGYNKEGMKEGTENLQKFFSWLIGIFLIVIGLFTIPIGFVIILGGIVIIYFGRKKRRN